jgi:large subunit ribosomal protein L5
MAETTTSTAVRLRDLYADEVQLALQAELGLANIMQVPKLKKIVVNMGVVTPPSRRSCSMVLLSTSS